MKTKQMELDFLSLLDQTKNGNLPFHLEFRLILIPIPSSPTDSEPNGPLNVKFMMVTTTCLISL